MIEHLSRSRASVVPHLGAATIAAAVGLLCLPSQAAAAVTYKGGSVVELLKSDSADAGEVWKELQEEEPHLDNEKLMTLVTGYAKGGDERDVDDPEVLAAYIALDYRFLVKGEIRLGSLNAFLDEQRVLAAHVKTTPEVFKEKVVTVGFEHEFLKHHTATTLAEAGIEKAGCSVNLTEVDHAVLFKSQTRINGLRFLIETDADNELELVTPPFLVRTVVEGVPLPDWSHVTAFEEMMTRTVLGPINRLVEKATMDRTPLRLPDLARFLGDKGIDFPEQARQLTIQATQLTHRTPGIAVAKSVNAETLANVCLHSAPKGKTLISNQVNFATDALTFTAHKYVARTSADPDNDWYRLWLEIMAAMKSSAKFPEGRSTPMKAFLLEYAAAMANQVALPAMREYLEYVKKLERQEALPQGDRYDRDLAKYEDLGSFVKDWSGIWLKTSLYNFGCSLLSEGEWNHVAAIITDEGFTGALAMALDRKSLSEFYKASDVNEERPQVHEAKRRIREFGRKVLERFHGPFCQELDQRFEIGGRRVQIFEHNEKDLGPRQDTYIGFSKVQMEAIWPGVKLHVVEDREDDDRRGPTYSHKNLFRLGRALKEAANADDRKRELEGRVDALWNLGADIPQPKRMLEDR